ncbi:DUF6702 family protein [Litorilituus lipolyticus]|uniref:DUF6702 family protein n=1 Tax=Litorilituus lipolyticus TaxID=2491017 RepID=UPI003CCC7AA0
MSEQNFLKQLVVKNTILVDTYAKHVNTVNFQDSKEKGSLTFSRADSTAVIATN